MIDQDKFIETYAATFMASQASLHYRLGADIYTLNPSADDAIRLARAAWGRMLEYGFPQQQISKQIPPAAQCDSWLEIDTPGAQLLQRCRLHLHHIGDHRFEGEREP